MKKQYKILTHNGMPIDEYTLKTYGEIKGTGFPRLRPADLTMNKLISQISLECKTSAVRGKAIEILQSCKLTNFTLEMDSEDAEPVLKKVWTYSDITVTSEVRRDGDLVRIKVFCNVGGKELVRTIESNDLTLNNLIAEEQRIKNDIIVEINK